MREIGIGLVSFYSTVDTRPIVITTAAASFLRSVLVIVISEANGCSAATSRYLTIMTV